MRRCRACAPPARTAVWVAASSRRRTAQAARRLRAIRITRRTSAGSAPKVRHSGRLSASARGSSIRCCASTTARSRASIGTWRSIASADGFKRIIERDGPDAVAFYLSGQLLTEDYYVANKLMKGFIGSANVDTNSRLCMASSVAGHKRAFGSDTVPGLYEDLDQADLIVLVGSNAAWCHPVLFQRMQENRRERGAKLVVIDPRRTATAAEADLHLPIKPGMDTALFCGLLVRLADRDTFDRCYVEKHTTGFEAALARATEIAPDIAAVARTTGLDEADVRAFYDLFAATERVVTCLFAGREPVGARHRQGQRHHQLPFGDRPHRPARHRAVLADRPAQRDGRPRGRRPRQPVGRTHELHPARDRSRAPLLERPEHRHARRPQGRADVRGDRARRDQGALGDGDQSGRVAAARGRDARGAARSSNSSLFRRTSPRTTR